MKPASPIAAPVRGRPRTGGLRQRILAVADRTFAEHPFHEVRMDDVAGRSGVAKGTLYLYFAGKRQLYLAVLFEGLERLRGALASVSQGTAAPRDRLHHTVTCLLRHVSRRHSLGGLLHRHELGLEPREARQWGRRRERLSAVLQSAIAGAIAAGDLRRIDPRIGEQMLLGIVRGLQEVAREDRDQLTEEAMSLFLHGTAKRSRQCLVRRKTAR
jgi:AcrR family transcriptional regulator